MELRKRFWGSIASMMLLTGGAGGAEPREIDRNPAAPALNTKSMNQKLAEDVARAIARAVPDRGYTVSLEYQNGVVTLRGVVSSPTQMLQVVKAAQATASVNRVVNELTIARSSPVQTTEYQDPAPAPEVSPMPGSDMPAGSGEQTLVPAAPEHVAPQGAAPQYDWPYMPPFAWPAYAPYPNYSAVQYPRLYPGRAWPYLGPFHPYPEPPLDWRAVKMTYFAGPGILAGHEDPPVEWQAVRLQWDDGQWTLRFCYPTYWWHVRDCLSGLIGESWGAYQQSQATGCAHGAQCCAKCCGFGGQLNKAAGPCGVWHLWFKQAWRTHRYVN